MKKTRKLFTVLMALVMIMTIVRPVPADAAAKPKLNKKKVTLTITDKKKNPTANLKAKNATGKVKWSTSNKKVATVKNGKVTAKSVGKATITCKVNKKKLTCKVTVKDKRTNKNDTSRFNITVKSVDSGVREHGLEAGDNYVTVTYNGKDVTKKASYELQENGKKNVSEILTGGIITKSGTVGIYRNGNYTLVVTYQGIEKTVKLKIESPYVTYIECHCGAKFGDDYDAYRKHDEESMQNGGVPDYEIGEAYEIGKSGCTGYDYVPYALTKVTIVK